MIVPNKTMQDKELFALVKEGNAIAYRELYHRHWDKLYNSVYKRLKNQEQAKDITQDIFLQLWVKRETVNIDNFQAYLLTAGKYSVFRYMEQQKKFVPVEELLSKIKNSPDQADSKLLMAEFLKAWEAVIGSLPDAQQTIFRMRYQQDLTPIQIAQELNISIKTVRNQLGKALVRLKTSFMLILLIYSFLEK